MFITVHCKNVIQYIQLSNFAHHFCLCFSTFTNFTNPHRLAAANMLIPRHNVCQLLAANLVIFAMFEVGIFAANWTPWTEWSACSMTCMGEQITCLRTMLKKYDVYKNTIIRFFMTTTLQFWLLTASITQLVNEHAFAAALASLPVRLLALVSHDYLKPVTDNHAILVSMYSPNFIITSISRILYIIIWFFILLIGDLNK